VNDLLRSLILPALGIALNPVPILAAVALLMTKHGKRNCAIFLVTLAVVMYAVGALEIFLIGQAEASGNGSASTGSVALQILFGLIFLAVAVMQWRTPSGSTPTWMDKMDTAGFVASAILGFALTNYALVSTAAATIIKASVSSTDQAIALAFFTALAVSTVAIILIAAVVAPRWSDKKLVKLRVWLLANSRVILIVVFGFMGLLFIGLGIYHLVT
jgi:hypothetical protein